MSSALTTRFLAENEYPEWNRLVGRSAEGSVYSQPEYLVALCEAAGGRFRILAAQKGDELAGGIALYERGSGSSAYVGPRLLLYYNGILLRPYETRYPSERTARRNEILKALGERLSSLRYDHVSLRCRSPLQDVRALIGQGWTARPQYSYVVPIADLERLRGRMEGNLRRLVDRCAAQKLTVTEDDDFDAFFRMHLQTHERTGMRLYLPEAAFRRYIERLRARGIARLYHARLPGGEPVSTQLVLTGGHPVSHTVCAATDAAHRNLGATAFLRWEVFRRLSAEGIAANDLTDAALNPVTHFKAQLGGDLEMCLWLEAPGSARFRAARTGREAAHLARSALRAVARRLRRRG